MRIDAHQHFWNYHPVKHDWIDDQMAVIRRDFSPSDLLGELKGNQIDGCVALQADQTLDETNFLVDLASKNDFIKAVVGWVDLRSNNLDKELELLSDHNIIKGFRHVVQGEADHNFILRDAFTKGIQKLGNYKYTYDILVFPHQLGAVLEFVKKFPNQKFVIDHIAKPYIKDGYFHGWAALMSEIGKCENVSCKLSGMVTEANYQHWSYDQLLPYMEHTLESFTTDRLLFGSDWPVCLVAATYREIVDVAQRFISTLSSDEQNNIMGENARLFYTI